MAVASQRPSQPKPENLLSLSVPFWKQTVSLLSHPPPPFFASQFQEECLVNYGFCHESSVWLVHGRNFTMNANAQLVKINVVIWIILTCALELRTEWQKQKTVGMSRYSHFVSILGHRIVQLQISRSSGVQKNSFKNKDRGDFEIIFLQVGDPVRNHCRGGVGNPCHMFAGAAKTSQWEEGHCQRGISAVQKMPC